MHHLLPAFCRVLWGLGQLGFCPALLLGTISTHLQQPGVLGAFEPRQLAMATYAFAALDFFPGEQEVQGWVVRGGR